MGSEMCIRDSNKGSKYTILTNIFPAIKCLNIFSFLTHNFECVCRENDARHSQSNEGVLHGSLMLIHPNCQCIHDRCTHTHKVEGVFFSKLFSPSIYFFFLPLPPQSLCHYSYIYIHQFFLSCVYISVCLSFCLSFCLSVRTSKRVSFFLNWFVSY